MLSLNFTIYPRLHLTLIDLNKNGYRINGGFGFSINKPTLNISILKSDQFEIIDNRRLTLTSDEKLRLRSIVEDVKFKNNFRNNIRINITGEMQTHQGLGSGTSIRLACLEALYILNNSIYNEEKIVDESKRGGTSGIGVRTYFRGGYIFDAGRKNLPNDIFAPSSQQESAGPSQSMIISEGLMPSWELGLIILDSILPTLSHEAELEFFKLTTPIPALEVQKTLYHICYGLLPAIKENDFMTFNIAINEIQKCFWKSSERNIYGQKLQDIEDILVKNGALSVGMSSMGPSLFFFAHNLDILISKMSNLGYTCIKALPQNQGRLIQKN